MMKKVFSLCSPVICYDILFSNNSYHIDVYIEGFADSEDPHSHCFVEDLCPDAATAEKFAAYLSENAAMPIHVPELTETFLANIR